MEAFKAVLEAVDGIVWGPIMIVLLVGTGIYLTIRLKLIQVSSFGHAIKVIKGDYDHESESKDGEISHFQALSAALSATIGTGNIAGVATAIAIGGPGALFWMWVTAFFGMATKYSSCLLGLKYREIDENGEVTGGPMLYLEKGLGQKWLGVLFAIFAVVASFGIGNMVQANSVAEPVAATFGLPKWLTGVVMGVLVWLVIVGGIKRIGKVASKIVPFMSVAYVLAAFIVLAVNFSAIPSAFALIFTHAFTPTSASGGFAGAVVLLTMRYGVARGVFSNEAGLGSAPMAHAAAKTDEPVREGLVAMIGPFIDTIIICTMTGLAIVTSGAWDSGLTGAELTSEAFNLALPGVGRYLIAVAIVFFAFSTTVSWSYYGDRCVMYLSGEKQLVRAYRWLYALMIPVGAILKLEIVWTFSDIANGLMALPNIIGLLGLSGTVIALTKTYVDKLKIPVA
ncbi:sodium:alanine symporter family protein [Marispirochaeta aestuarii]|uniref:alanine/glycine:cation symporter family protein n=1 Tax=Marispirochaeta aestuarii TaxID=1963862 RepID=UPI0029C9096D|nr:sodium:alanine symporter family protein [Marispirochaeta aestuarii]